MEDSTYNEAFLFHVEFNEECIRDKSPVEFCITDKDGNVKYKPRIKEVDAVIKDYVLPIRYVSTYPATINEVSYKIKDLNYKIKDVAFGFIQSIWKDTVSISNVKTYQKTFNRSFSAELDIGFKNVSNFTKTLNSAIKFSFEKLGNSGQIISDIRLYDKVL